MHRHTIGWVFAVAFAGCLSSQVGSTSDPVGGEAKPLSAEECKAHGGSVVGDTGNGATHRSDYVCASGKAPLGDITPPEGGPFPVEGAVCCPR
jgi:hypothetical protein